MSLTLIERQITELEAEHREAKKALKQIKDKVDARVAMHGGDFGLADDLDLARDAVRETASNLQYLRHYRDTTFKTNPKKISFAKAWKIYFAAWDGARAPRGKLLSGEAHTKIAAKALKGTGWTIDALLKERRYQDGLTDRKAATKAKTKKAKLAEANWRKHDWSQGGKFGIDHRPMPGYKQNPASKLGKLAMMVHHSGKGYSLAEAWALVKRAESGDNRAYLEMAKAKSAYFNNQGRRGRKVVYRSAGNIARQRGKK